MGKWKRNLKEYFRVMEFLRPHTGVLILAISAMAVASLFDGISLGMIIPLVDNILTGKGIHLPDNPATPEWLIALVRWINQTPPLELLNFLILITVSMLSLKLLFNFFSSFLMNDLSHRVMRDLRSEVYRKMLNLSMDFFHRQKTGALMSRITADCGVLQYCFAEGLMDSLYQPIQLTVYFVVLFTIRSFFGIPWSFVIVLAFLVPLMIYPIVRIGKRLRKISVLSQQKIAEVTTALLEGINGIRMVKVFGTEKLEWDRFNKDNHKFYRLTLSSIKRQLSVTPVTEFTVASAVGIVLWMGGREVLGGSLSTGAFAAFMAALLSLMKPFKRIGKVYGFTQQALGSASRIFEIYDEVPSVREKAGAVQMRSFDDSLVFEGVGFQYLDETPVLRDINLKVKKGEVLAIVGPSGSGKSTLVNLIPRLYDPTCGRILVDGKDIREFTLDSLRSRIGMVTQETILFNDTVLANIVYGLKNPFTDDEVILAAQMACAHEFIIQLPEGYQTTVGDRGWNLSGGERQRIAIARALLRNSPILILDEATSQLDTESERSVQEAIECLMQHRTVFVIAHRLSTVQNADRIIVIGQEGRIQEEGTHEALLKMGKLYARLYQLQFAEETEVKEPSKGSLNLQSA